MTEFASFGDPRKFAVAVRWANDSEPRGRRPARFGWSMGDLKITIAGRTITQSRRGTATQSHTGWYLFPLFDWLASNWGYLLHEEDFCWTERSSAPALVACRRALERWIGETDEVGRNTYRDIQGWYRRHALRACSAGGLFPDLFIRRFFDDIELSWSPHAPLFAPEGYSYVTEPGSALLPVGDVAGPLWEALNWAVSVPPAPDAAEAIETLERKIDTIRETPLRAFAAIYVPSNVLTDVQAALARLGAADLLRNERAGDVPAITSFAPAVAMFGGVSPNLGAADVDTIARLLVSRMNVTEAPALEALTCQRAGRPLSVPHEDGYAFAAELLDELGEPADGEFVDVRAMIARLDIEVRETQLSTGGIRGVALAGDGFGPTILVNTTSIYNSAEDGRRFTLAHELCHILFDRTRARRVTVASGRWVAPGIEKRANAFAAFLLMPRELVRRLLPTSGRIDRDDIVSAARQLRVSESALVEHAYNLDLIGDADRERLRAAFRM
jgi:Zn-dependent peptidase ImmA (M78 family)